MASPPPDAIRQITSEGAQVARGLWELEHGAGLAGRTTFREFAQRRYGITYEAAGYLHTYLLRIHEVGVRLANSPGVVPRGGQARNPDLPLAYRVRVYATIGAGAGGRTAHVPLDFDFARNPTMAQVEAAARRWHAEPHRQTAMRTWRGYE